MAVNVWSALPSLFPQPRVGRDLEKNQTGQHNHDGDGHLSYLGSRKSHENHLQSEGKASGSAQNVRVAMNSVIEIYALNDRHGWRLALPLALAGPPIARYRRSLPAARRLVDVLRLFPCPLHRRSEPETTSLDMSHVH